jgi:6-phosphofructokinase 2
VTHHDGGPAHIVTLTMNPALDITTTTQRVTHTDKLRCGTPRYDPGGGGINVARVAATLGASVCAVFPVGGQTGARVVALLAEEGVAHRPVHIAGITREDMTVDETSTGRQYRFVLPGPMLTAAEERDCLSALRSEAVGARYVVASGSLPPEVSAGFLQDVSDVCREVGAKFVLDSSGRGLEAVTRGVHLVKPSLRELREYSGQPLIGDNEQLAAARELVDAGRAENVVVSRGSDDALIVTPTADHRIPAPIVRSVSAVGAGDALVAGIVVGLDGGWPLVDAVRVGMAAGAAMLLTPGTATCRAEDVQELLETIRPAGAAV